MPILHLWSASALALTLNKQQSGAVKAALVADATCGPSSQGVVLISCTHLGQRGAWMPQQNRGASDSGRQSLNEPSSTSPPAPPCDPVAEHHM